MKRINLYRSIMNLLCIIAFISYSFAEPTRFAVLMWIIIAFINVNVGD